MELPAEVLIHNAILGLKGTRATLIRISQDGYFEVDCRFGDNLHRTFLPIANTVLISRDPEEPADQDLEVLR